MTATTNTLYTTVDVEIPRPADVVWSVVTDYATDTEWRKGITEMTPDREGPPAVGTQVREVLHLGGQLVSIGGGLRYWVEDTDASPEGLALRFVVTLLFQETFFGHSHHEVVELLKLVSGSERELLDNRAILGRSSRLVRREIVSIDFPAGEREQVAEASLAAWTHEKMLFDTGDQRAPLDAKARRDFLDFLNSLRGSDEFYRGLEDGR